MSREWRVTDGAAPHSQPPRLLDQLRGRIRLKHYSIRILISNDRQPGSRGERVLGLACP